jgi:hypothetical protein
MKMANNRMYLRVKGKPDIKILLAKYYPPKWEIYHPLKKLNEWLGKLQIHCPIVSEDQAFYGPTNLELVFELADDKTMEEDYVKGRYPKIGHE